MPNELVQHYHGLLDESPAGCAVAMCWSVIKPLAAPISIEDVARRLGGGPDDLEAVDLNEYGSLENGWILHLDQAESAVTIYEANGFQCTLPNVLQALSVGAEVYSAYWSVNSDNSLTYAVDGEVLTSIEGLGPDHRHGMICTRPWRSPTVTSAPDAGGHRATHRHTTRHRVVPAKP